MLLSLESSVTALDQFQESIDVIGNNIANVNTVGFKSSTSDFEDTFSQTVGSNATGPMQVGTGVATLVEYHPPTAAAVPPPRS